MKHISWMVGLVAGIALGGAAGWNAASIRIKHDADSFMEEAAKSETLAQESLAAQAYLNGTPEQAYNELKRLLDTYARYATWPEIYPGERAERDGFAMAIAHGRLANTCAKLDLIDEARFHFDEALRHPGIGDEQKLKAILASADKAEGRRSGVLP